MTLVIGTANYQKRKKELEYVPRNVPKTANARWPNVKAIVII